MDDSMVLPDLKGGLQRDEHTTSKMIRYEIVDEGVRLDGIGSREVGNSIRGCL